MQVDPLRDGLSGVRRAAVVLAGAGLTALLVAGCGSGGQAASESGEASASADAQAAPLPVVDDVDEAVGATGEGDTTGQDESADDYQGGDHRGGGAPLIVRANGTSLTEDCAARKVIVLASDADLTLNGACSLVKVQGGNSTVDVGSAQKIIAVGPGSAVHYASGRPQVVNKGGTVSQGGSATP
ncbi:DUF3060 domain-containing protein [Saccharopolyspora indica]|uniref:DUF3060 domain-containing protein n=1 Tax=Saccharopolyspora indica TaxID=1229659 RepID=UPI0022EB787D|nr:DUF3060 domain-containing protein [Saccharopolyspora indica]MDA3648715.1 DUF3060 domain-containing protein [Saccharopolyspora indica]